MVEHWFFLMKYLVVRCETFFGKKICIFDKTFYEKNVFKFIFKPFIEIYILTYEWYIFDTKRLMFESTNECLKKKLKGFEFEILFLT